MNYLIYPDEPLLYVKAYLLSRPHTQVCIPDLTGCLQPKKIGVIRGYSFGAKLDQKIMNYRENANSSEHMYKMLKQGRVGAALMFYSLAEDKFIEPIPKDIIPNELPMERKALYLAFSITPEMVKLSSSFSTLLKNYKQTKEYKDLVQKYVTMTNKHYDSE